MHNSEDIISNLQLDNERLQNQLDNALSDISRLRSRIDSEKELILEKGETLVLDNMVEVTDDFIRAIINNKKIDDVDALKEGFELIFHKLISSFKKLDVRLIHPYPHRDKFDDETMEAVNIVKTSNPFKSGYVADTIKSGYMLKGKVIKHAQVSVFKTFD